MSRLAIEKRLLAIWSEVLQVDHIGVDDDFLGLGGDSLAAMRCINRISAEFEVDVTLEMFLADSPSVAGVAAVVEGLVQQYARAEAPEYE